MENVANGATKTFTVPVKPNGQLGVNITLTWSDPPAALNSRGPALINNLDLKVQDSAGKQYLPTNPLTGNRGPIARDTVEKVIITTGELQGVTSLTVTVTGTTVPQGPVQPFALVAGGAIAATTPVATQPPQPPRPPNPPGGVVIDVIDNIGKPPPGGGAGTGGGDQAIGGGGGSGPVNIDVITVDSSGNIIDGNNPNPPSAVDNNVGNGNVPKDPFSRKNASTFGLIVFANVGALVVIIIVIIVLKVVGCWCGLANQCSLVIVLILRALALGGTIIAFVFIAIEQKNIEEAYSSAKFGTFWQQILMLIALGASVVMVIVGTLLGVLQVMREPSQLLNVVLLLADFIVALGLGAGSIATANVGKEKYLLLRQSLAALITMGIYLLTMIVDAAHAFDDSGESEDTAKANTYKPSQNKTTYKPSQTSGGGARREAPKAPKEFSKPRPKSTRGEILVALYDYQGQESDELDFEEGARIELIEDHADGWATGVVMSTMKEGLFPLNYTEKE